MEKTEYKSFEERYAPSACEYFQGLYGGVAGFLRLPTTIRKLSKKQLLCQKFDDAKIKNIKTMLSGIGTGLFIDGIAAGNLDNSKVLCAWLAANLASGIYELSRAARKNIKAKRQSILEKTLRGAAK